MALALNSIIPHTTALSLSTSLPSPKMPSSPQFQQPHNLRQSGQIVQSAASSSSNIAVSDVKLQLQEEDHSNGFNPTSTFAPAWSEFARNVSGEWDGHGADFTREGYPIELPENVVPEAYREWEVKDKGTYKLQELEYCLINPQDKESRVRIIQVIRIENEKMMLQNIRVYCENWYGPFRNGDQLGGCAIRDSAFACTAALEASEVVGTWRGLGAVASFRGTQNNVLQELLVNSEQSSMRDESGLVLLPKRLWCSIKESKDGDTCSKEISVANETAVFKGT
ncbi:hypothetical protein ACFX15_034615 [Malus domestica]